MHLYTHALCNQHEVPAGHPECSARLEAVMTHLKACGLTQDCEVHTPAPANDDLLRLAHSQDLLTFLQDSTPSDPDEIVPIDPDTWLGHSSLSAARMAAGATCSGIEDIIQGTTKRVFCAVRPPGHHAEHNGAMGFCLFNSIAIGALHALNQNGINRVAILDFDVHHGNGTVDICRHNPNILVCSSFQHPHYPNRLFDVVADHIVNTPLAAGTDGSEFRKAIEAAWLPALERHQPDLILVSAGFDAHQLDPLANLNLTEADFTWVTQLIVDAANTYSEGRILSTLEGGYELGALARSVEAHVGALLTSP